MRWPSRKSCLSSRAEAPSRPEGHAERVGGAERSALHGAEHGFSLKHVMAAVIGIDNQIQFFGDNATQRVVQMSREKPLEELPRTIASSVR
jgi:hypothetical protein